MQLRPNLTAPKDDWFQQEYALLKPELSLRPKSWEKAGGVNFWSQCIPTKAPESAYTDQLVRSGY